MIELKISAIRSELLRLTRVRSAWASTLGVLACVALYGLFVLPRLGSPGLNLEEVYTIMPALKLLGYKATAGDLAFLEFKCLSLPLAFGLYHGAIESYLAAPFIAALGTTPEALSACTIFLGAATLSLFFHLARALTRSRAFGAFGAVLLAVHPTFVSATREGFNGGSALLLFETAALLGLLYWRRTGRAGPLYAACLALGLGLGSRGWFIYCLPALAVLAVVFRPRASPRDLARRALRSWRTFFFSLVIFMLGAMPFILQHVRLQFQGGGPSIFSMMEADNLDYRKNLSVRLTQIESLLHRDVILEEQFPQAPSEPYRFHWPVFCACLVWSLASLRLGRGRSGWAARTFFLVYFIVFLAGSTFTLRGLNALQLLPLLPVAAIIVTLSVQDALRFLRPDRRAPLLALLVVLALALDAPKIQSRLKGGMAGVSMLYSDATSQAALWLRNNDHRHVATLDWGMLPIDYLEAGRITLDRYWYAAKLPPEEREKGAARMRRSLSNPDSIYLMYVDPPKSLPSAQGLFFEEIRRLGMGVVELARFSREDGRPVIRAVRARP